MFAAFIVCSWPQAIFLLPLSASLLFRVVRFQVVAPFPGRKKDSDDQIPECRSVHCSRGGTAFAFPSLEAVPSVREAWGKREGPTAILSLPCSPKPSRNCCPAQERPAIGVYTSSLLCNGNRRVLFICCL